MKVGTTTVLVPASNAGGVATYSLTLTQGYHAL